MSVHDRAAARHARRFTLTVMRHGSGYMQTVEFPNLTEREVEARKRLEREMRPENPAYGIGVDFEVATC